MRGPINGVELSLAVSSLTVVDKSPQTVRLLGGIHTIVGERIKVLAFTRYLKILFYFFNFLKLLQP